MGFDISDGYNREPLSVWDVQLLRGFLKDYQYMALTVMGAVAKVIATKIAVWVQHPQCPDRLVVHREYQVRPQTRRCVFLL